MQEEDQQPQIMYFMNSTGSNSDTDLEIERLTQFCCCYFKNGNS